MKSKEVLIMGYAAAQGANFSVGCRLPNPSLAPALFTRLQNDLLCVEWDVKCYCIYLFWSVCIAKLLELMFTVWTDV